MISTALFDLDGTILDSLYVWGDVDRAFFIKRGITDYSGFDAATIAMNLREASVYTKERFALPESPEAIVDEWMATVSYEYANTIPPKPGVCEFIKALSAHGVRLALATSSQPELYRPALERLGLYSLFEAFFSSKDSYPKADERYYSHCAESLKVAPGDCTVFDDAPPCLKAAKAAGLRVCCVYNVQWDIPEAEAREFCDIYVKDFRDLPRELRFS